MTLPRDFTFHFTSSPGGRTFETMKKIEDPLTGRAPAAVPLKDAPLVRVLAQVRFPPITSIERPEFIAPFQEAIRATYPVLRPERGQGFLFVGEGAPSHTTPTQVIWRFHDTASAWRVSLAPEFLAIETTEYRSRTDFLARLETIVMALATHVGPQTIDRFGLRYIDRVRDVDAARIGELVRPEVLGVLGTPIAGNLQYSLNESLLQVPGTTSQMRVR